jgi:hypothetical protein
MMVSEVQVLILWEMGSFVWVVNDDVVGVSPVADMVEIPISVVAMGIVGGNNHFSVLQLVVVVVVGSQSHLI